MRNSIQNILLGEKIERAEMEDNFKKLIITSEEMRDSGYYVQTTQRSSEWTSKRTRRPNKRDRADSKEHGYCFLRLSKFGALSSFPEGQTANEEFYPTAFRRLLAAVL